MCWDSAVATAIGTWILAVAAFLAVLYEPMKNKWYRPRLSASVEAKPPDCVKIPYVKKTAAGIVSAEAQSYYVRFRIRNKGRKNPAEGVMVYLENVEVLDQGDSRDVPTYIPLPLAWSNLPGHLFYPKINRGLDIHCDIGFILHPGGRRGFEPDNISPIGVTNDDLYMCWDTIVKPNSGSSLVPPGEYRLSIKVTASNATPIAVKAKIHVPEKWIDSESDMYSALNPKIVEIAEMK